MAIRNRDHKKNLSQLDPSMHSWAQLRMKQTSNEIKMIFIQIQASKNTIKRPHCNLSTLGLSERREPDDDQYGN